MEDEGGEDPGLEVWRLVCLTALNNFRYLLAMRKRGTEAEEEEEEKDKDKD